MNNTLVKRSELKYFINYIDYIDLTSRLSRVIETDQHSTPFKGYTVRSLYFDSINDICLNEKQGGQLLRKKYRIRIYNTNPASAKFEVKSKLNNQIQKQSVSISSKSANDIIDGNHRELLSYENPLMQQVYTTFISKQFQPRVIVEYQRDAYLFDAFNIRITIDKDIRSCTSNLSLFSNEMHLIPVIESDRLILEIKFDQGLPDFILDLLQLSRFERTAISKYVLSRRFFKTHQWEDA